MKRLLPLLLIFTCPAALAQTPGATPAPPEVASIYRPTSLAPEGAIPRTPDGRPDFQDAIWATDFFPVFGVNPMTPHLVVSESEAEQIVATMVKGMQAIPDFQIDPEADVIIGDSDGLPIVRGERRTRLIVLPADGKLPLTDAARARLKGDDSKDERKDDYEQRPASERCIVLSGNPPTDAIVSYNRMRFVQTPDHMVIHNENGDEARIIPFTNAHRPDGPRSWYGDSIARWEGDTLVVETIRQSPEVSMRGLMTKYLVTENARVIERFTRISTTELLYQFTVEDPEVYSAPWLGEYSFFATDTGMYASPCHEHNHSLPNILLGQRMADLRAAN